MAENIRRRWASGMKDCPACNGRGYQEDKDGIKRTCPVCDGTGVVLNTFGNR